MAITITPDILESAYVGFNESFAEAFEGHRASYAHVAMDAPSNTTRNTYPWLGDLPALRPWVGDRVVRGVSQHGFSIENEDWELTLAVARNDIEDEQLGAYKLLFANMGDAAAQLPDDLVWPLLNDGFTKTGYDGRPFFDTSHPVTDANGKKKTASNMQTGDKTPWFLVDRHRAIKPLIYQTRKAPTLMRKDDDGDDNVFYRKEYIYGVDARAAAGYGLWQLAYGSKADLTSDNFNQAMSAMMSLKGDNERPLNIMPNLLIVPPALRAAAYAVVKAERLSNGSSNVNHNVVDVHIEPRLA